MRKEKKKKKGWELDVVKTERTSGDRLTRVTLFLDFSLISDNVVIIKRKENKATNTRAPWPKKQLFPVFLSGLIMPKKGTKLSLIFLEIFCLYW